jgi:hypothetical protein
MMEYWGGAKPQVFMLSPGYKNISHKTQGALFFPLALAIPLAMIIASMRLDGSAVPVPAMS